MNNSNPAKNKSLHGKIEDLASAEITDRFQSTFGSIFNIIELVVEDKEKAKAVKNLIGGLLAATRDDCCVQVRQLFN